MRVLFVTPECYPLVKTGGLADVTGALPLALAGLGDHGGVQARVLLPGYPGLADKLVGVTTAAELADLFGGPARLVAGLTDSGLEVLLLDAPHLYERGGGPYLDPDGQDWPDNDHRFAALSWVGAAVAVGALADRLGGWQADLVHLHDWQAALTAAYLRYPSAAGLSVPGARAAVPTLLTIHNLAFQGLFAADRLRSLLLAAESFTVEGIEYYGNISFLKAGVRYADRVSTVSPTYAREIVTPAEGMGFDGLLRARADGVVGIVNGIDDDVWNPVTDPLIVSAYSSRRLAAKQANKVALQSELGLAASPDAPLFCVVSRLTTQKGLDLLLGALATLLTGGGQLALLGTGDGALETAYRRAAGAYPAQIAAVIGYDEALSHRMQAGADAIIVPSRFEPCGLTQLYGLRYGTLPVVARVGGLADTVIDANDAAMRDGVATGFQFAPIEADALAVALERAMNAFWQKMQRRAMSRDVGWSTAAASYATLYREMVERASATGAPSAPAALRQSAEGQSEAGGPA
jgi:starch synthase